MDWFGYLNEFALFDNVTIFLTTFCIVITLIYIRTRNSYNFPPGPVGWPFIGILPLMNEAEHAGKPTQTVMTGLSEQYGSVFSFRLGSRLIVCVGTLEATKDAFNNVNICGREATLLQSIRGCPGEGIISSSGQVWSDHRRFFLAVLRKFDIGKAVFEEKLIDEASHLSDVIAELVKGQPLAFDLTQYIANATANSVSSVLFGKNYDYDDYELKELLQHIYVILKFIGAGGKVFFLPPFLVKNVIYRRQYQEYVRSVCHIRHIFQKVIENHMRHHEMDNHVTDVVDAYLAEISKTEGQRTSFNINNLGAVMGDLVCAAFDTTVQTLRWVFLYSITYPELQQRIQQELDCAMNNKGLPRRSDTSKIPYTEAFLLEVQRLQTVLPMGGQHLVTDDTLVHGYDVPKGSIVLSNLWQIHHDPKVWKDPEVFKPERFLDDAGKVRVPPNFIPFSTGRRSCVAEKMAKSEVLYFFTHLVHRFTFSKPEGAPETPLVGLSGFVNEAPYFEVCAVPRH